MSYTQVQICKLALANIGHTERIQAMDEASEAAYNCDLYYDPALRAALELYPWNFARKIATLALLAEDPDDYEYAYQVPSDCVRPLYILPKDDPTIVFERRGSKIYTDEEEAILAYTFYEDNPANYTPNFVLAFSYSLAASLALSLASDQALQKQMLSLAQSTAINATTADAKIGKTTSKGHSDILDARA